MEIKFLQLNIQGGRCLENIFNYIKEHDFDIIHMQEITGGDFSKFIQTDIFQEIKDSLHYDGRLTKTMMKVGDPSTYFGNATFFKPTFSVTAENVIWLEPEKPYPTFPTDHFETLSRNALHIQLTGYNKTIDLINTHLAWGPNPDDEPYKLDQAKILVDYLTTVKKPFLLSGDFNVTPDSQIVRWIDSLARNLTSEHKLTNTLNPNIHRAKMLFPKGLAVDYIYVSEDVTVKNFKLIDTVDLSDHFGLSSEIKLED